MARGLLPGAAEDAGEWAATHVISHLTDLLSQRPTVSLSPKQQAIETLKELQTLANQYRTLLDAPWSMSTPA